ncbi:hypothetical protein Droror1_Dr00014341 [Drosera rotundifolia]
MGHELLILSKEMLRCLIICLNGKVGIRDSERAKGLIEGLLREKGIGYDYSVMSKFAIAIYVLHPSFGLKAAVFALQLFVDNVVDGMNIVCQSPKPILLATGETNIPYDWAYAENLSTEPAEVASSSSAPSSRLDPSSSMNILNYIVFRRLILRIWVKLRACLIGGSEVHTLTETVKQWLDEENDTDKAIPLPNVTSTILAMAIEYCKKHAGPEPEDCVAKDALKEWDAKFANVDQTVMFDLLLIILYLFSAANYMDIKRLLDLFCQSAANMIKNKTVEEVRQIFNIENNFTEEEECTLRDEHK